MDGETPARQVVPPATGQRVAWADVPDWLRDEVAAGLGGTVVEAVTQPGGFSPGVAVRLRLPGAFNIANALVALACLDAVGVPPDVAAAGVA